MAKSLLAHILLTQLNVAVETFNNMEIKQISMNKNYDIITQFEKIESVGYIYSLTNNLKKDCKYSFTDYIPNEFQRRHRELGAISKLLREKRYQTKIILGYKDYKLLARTSDEKIPWKKVAPLILSEEIEEFEIGILPKVETNKKRKKDDLFIEDNENERNVIVETQNNDLNYIHVTSVINEGEEVVSEVDEDMILSINDYTNDGK